MLPCNLTPFVFGAKVCSRRPPAPEMTVIVRGTFGLRPGEPLALLAGLNDQGALGAEELAEDDDERQGECFYGGDFADYKQNAELLLRGSCHAPGGKPVTECPVLFRVGSWSKMLRVIGPRVWTEKLLGASISEPAPFVTMPLSYRNAFGGPGYAKNPVGKGYKTAELPTVEQAGDILRARSDRPDPASFGPLSPAWPARAGKLGKAYGGDYRKTRAPYYAEDFDWSYFQAAPADQQLQGYLHGDEELTFQNLHPAVQVYRSRLPGLRIRAFVNDVDGRFRELSMVLDTLHADLDREQVRLTWRGVTAVREDDLADVKTLLVAQEKLGDERLPEAHYRRLLADFERDPVGLEKRFPSGVGELLDRWDKQRAGEPVPPVAGAASLDPVSRALADRLGNFDADNQAKLAAAIEEGTAGLGPHVDVEAELQKAMAASADTPPLARPLEPGALPDLGLRRKMREILAQVAELKKALEGKEVPASAREQMAAMERVPFDPRWQKLDPEYTPPEGPISTDAPGPGRDLSEQDLSGRDLRGLDLTGARLDEAILTGADLRGARLRGASLRRAILWKADLTGADLAGADLRRANAASVRAAGASFQGAMLDRACFELADLSGANLREARGEYVSFAAADLQGAQGQRAALARSSFSGAKIARADLSAASLVSCWFEGSRGAVILEGADLSRASFSGADLRGAMLVELRADDASFLRATLDGADLSYATLRRALLDDLSAVEASFFGANLRECRLYRARLDRASFVRANLFGANLSRASAEGTRFNEASLYAAILSGLRRAGADFSGANLKRSTEERA